MSDPITFEELPGLSLYHDMMTPEYELDLITELNAGHWETGMPGPTGHPMKRSVQQFGFVYQYQSRSVVEGLPFPPRLQSLRQTLDQYFSIVGEPINQCIVNAYLRNQGITPHIDSNIFGKIIISISLAEDTIMDFTRGSERISVFLPRRSMLVMSGEPRELWKHEIKSNVSYQIPDGQKVVKSRDYRRISLTFRHVI